MIEYGIVDNLVDARRCDELLTKLIQSERKFNDNINKDYIVNNWFENLYNKDGNVIYIAKDKGNVVGYLYCKIISDHTGLMNKKDAFIDGLFVEENYRNMGIATKLLSEAKNWSRENEANSIYLNVLCENSTASSFYYKNGFIDFEKKLKVDLQ